MTSDLASIFGLQASLGLLEILVHSDGFDDEGVLVSLAVHRLCGPRPEVSYEVYVSEILDQPLLELVEKAIADTG